MRDIADAGHEVGNHTWRHRNAWLLPPAAAAIDLHDAPGLPGAPERLLATMPRLLDLLEDRGYTAVPVGELLGLPSNSG